MSKESFRWWGHVKAVASGRVWGAILLAAATVAGCSDDGPTRPGAVRFGQVGTATIRVEAPLRLGRGNVSQVIAWESRGLWTLTEAISYEGRIGDVHMERSRQNPEVLAGNYAQWIIIVNELDETTLFTDQLEPGLDPTCEVTRSRVTVEIHDATRDETMSWTRCADGMLGSLLPQGAGPDAGAARVVNAALLARNFTQGESFVSVYAGSVPFGTLDRGQDSGAGLTEPLFINDQATWKAFWEQHAPDDQTGPPPVDFGSSAVVVGAVGLRTEAGDSVEIRRVLPVADGTVVEMVERVPGDFCSPASIDHIPFHIVVTPLIPSPVRFQKPIPVERVSCDS